MGARSANDVATRVPTEERGGVEEISSGTRPRRACRSRVGGDRGGRIQSGEESKRPAMLTRLVVGPVGSWGGIVVDFTVWIGTWGLISAKSCAHVLTVGKFFH